MDNLFITWVATTVTVLATILWNKLRRRKRTAQLPRGSFGWPLIGETLDFVSCSYSPRPESFMDKRRLLHGKVFKSHLFGSPTIVSTDAEVSWFVLQSDENTFVPWYPKSLTELMGKSSILLINGSLQKRIHGLIGTFFKSPHLKARITRDMQCYVFEAINHWKDDQLICIQEESKRAKKRMVMLIENIIQEKRKNKNGCTQRDVVDVLINDGSDRLTDDLISDNMIDLMIPAEDSVPVLVTLAIKYLSECPLALRHLEVITETLRMGNIISGIMRKAVRDVEIKGHFIPKGWCVLTYFRSVHLDESLYKEAYKFNPWRWKDKDVGARSFTPFGGGQRLCPGLDLARLQASIFLHHLVTSFTWVAEEDHIINFPTVRMKGGMPIRVRRKAKEPPIPG
ncbi:Cytochrome P450 90D2 [Cocos nucifera]|uniref:Cytochrome P450 90D2 n=1 Tax=Cocos nucifera TaxID=13894 RepID=A0A8K0HYB3_COCNU|nr:Cytochrome P450 90D2 [Cocos nucifera]